MSESDRFESWSLFKFYIEHTLFLAMEFQYKQALGTLQQTIQKLDCITNI